MVLEYPLLVAEASPFCESSLGCSSQGGQPYLLMCPSLYFLFLVALFLLLASLVLQGHVLHLPPIKGILILEEGIKMGRLGKLLVHGLLVVLGLLLSLL